MVDFILFHSTILVLVPVPILIVISVRMVEIGTDYLIEVFLVVSVLTVS